MSFLLVYYHSDDGSSCVQCDTRTEAANAIEGMTAKRVILDGEYQSSSVMFEKCRINADGKLEIDGYGVF